MSRLSIGLLLLLPCTQLMAAEVPLTPAPPAAEGTLAASVARASAEAAPAMRFLSSLAEDELLAALKATPALAALDKDNAGSPLALIVTHTVRPTAGGAAAGFVSAVLSGSTLGLLPVVTSDRFVVKYEVRLNGRAITTYTFEKTSTKATNIWAGSGAEYGGLGKGGLEWLKSTAAEVATKLSTDAALASVREDIAYYFPPNPAATAR